MDQRKSISVNLVLHCSSFNYIRLIAKDTLNLNNPLKKFLINPSIILYNLFALNIYEYPKYYQHQCQDNQKKNHTHNHLVRFVSYYYLQKSFEIFPKFRIFCHNPNLGRLFRGWFSLGGKITPISKTR